MPVTIDMDEVEAETAEAASSAGESLELIADLSIPGDVSYTEAVVLIAEIKDQHKDLTTRRDMIAKPMKLALAEVNKLFKPSIDKLAEAEEFLKKKVLAARVTLSAEADKLMEAAGKDGDHKLVLQADEIRPPEVKGVSIRTTWTGKVTDPSKLPKEFIIPATPNLDKLEKWTDSCKGDVDVPGWKVQKVESMAVTASKIERT
jgi:hypothetical protein